MSGVCLYRLEMDSSDLSWLRRHPKTDRIFPAVLHGEERSLPAWIGFRGRFSREVPKPSFDLWLTAPSGERCTCLHLSAAYRDPSLLRNRLAFTLFRSLGVPAPEAGHLWLTMNGVAAGLYTASPALNEEWLRQSSGRTGSVYYGVGGEGNFGLISRRTRWPKRFLAAGYEKHCPEDDDFSDLTGLIRQITLTDREEFDATIDRHIDADEFLHWLAGIVFICHTDGLIHNYALFRPDGGRWLISPWDCDGTFGRTPYGHPLSPGYMSIRAHGGNYLAARLLASQRWQERYREIWANLLAGPLRSGPIEKCLAAITDEIRSWGLREPVRWRSQSTFRREPDYIRRWLHKRRENLTAELSEWEPATMDV